MKRASKTSPITHLDQRTQDALTLQHYADEQRRMQLFRRFLKSQHVLLDAYEEQYECHKCGERWDADPELPHDVTEILNVEPDWFCPNGCNTPPEERVIQEDKGSSVLKECPEQVRACFDELKGRGITWPLLLVFVARYGDLLCLKLSDPDVSGVPQTRSVIINTCVDDAFAPPFSITMVDASGQSTFTALADPASTESQN